MTKTRSPVAFGDYVITRRIARGGMAEIYRARTRPQHQRPAQWAALKMMRSSLGHEELREHLFEREARIASRLSHPNIVMVYEFGQALSRPFIAMEYIRGRDVSHLLKCEKSGRTQISFELGLYIGQLAAAGLGYAQRLRDEAGRDLGIVHRDVSPGNVMVGYDGSVKVLDFGVARINESQGVSTQTGTLRGKFAYMSPEQTKGEALDARSDVFSFGTVLYELLTGSNCFRASSPIATLERVQGLRPAPPSRAGDAIPKEVDRILARCLAKDRRRRFQDCQVLSDAIGEYLDKIAFKGHELLVLHMSQEFEWERHEEAAELDREAEEVALLDVVDFGITGIAGDLDAQRMTEAHHDQVSEVAVKTLARRRDDADSEEQAVFDGAEDSWRPSTPVERETTGSETTVALPRENVLSEDVVAGRSVRALSLLAAPNLLPDLVPATKDPAFARTQVDPASIRRTAFGDLADTDGEGRPRPTRSSAFPSTPGSTADSGSVSVSLSASMATGASGSVSIYGAHAGATSMALTSDGPETLPLNGLPFDGPRTEPFPSRLMGEHLEKLRAQLNRRDSSGLRGSTRSDAPAITAIAESSAVVPVLSAKRSRFPGQRPTLLRIGTALGGVGVVGAVVVSLILFIFRGAEPSKDERSSPSIRKLEPIHISVSMKPEEAVPEPKPTIPLGIASETEDDQEERLVAAVATKSEPARRPRERSVRKPTGFLNIGARPWAEIKIDGRAWPHQTPQAGIELPAGRHIVTLHNPELGSTRTETVIIRPGATRTINLDMRKTGEAAK